MKAHTNVCTHIHGTHTHTRRVKEKWIHHGKLYAKRKTYNTCEYVMRISCATHTHTQHTGVLPLTIIRSLWFIDLSNVIFFTPSQGRRQCECVFFAFFSTLYFPLFLCDVCTSSVRNLSSMLLCRCVCRFSSSSFGLLIYFYCCCAFLGLI